MKSVKCNIWDLPFARSHSELRNKTSDVLFRQIDIKIWRSVWFEVIVNMLDYVWEDIDENN